MWFWTKELIRARHRTFPPHCRHWRGITLNDSNSGTLESNWRSLPILNKQKWLMIRDDHSSMRNSIPPIPCPYFMPRTTALLQTTLSSSLPRIPHTLKTRWFTDHPEVMAGVPSFNNDLQLQVLDERTKPSPNGKSMQPDGADSSSPWPTLCSNKLKNPQSKILYHS